VKKIIKIAIFASITLFFSFSNGHGGFSLGISPVRWEAAGKPGKTLRKVVVLTGGAGAIQKVKVGVGDWTLSEDGAPIFGKSGTMPESAASWIRYHPAELNVYPRQRKIVRLSIRIPDATPSGCYRVALFFEPPQSDEEGRKGATSVFLRGRLALLIYVTVGDARPEGEILDTAWRVIIKGRKPVPALKVHNRGNAHLRMNGIFAARTLSGKKFEGIIPALPILPGQTRWIPLEFQGEAPPPNSDLDLTLHVDLGDGERKVGVKIPGKSES